MKTIESLLQSCLYFATSNLSRNLMRLAEEEFSITGLSPSHAFILMTVNERPGIAPSELAEMLHLAPSTVTRFIDTLEYKGLLSRQFLGKTSQIFATESGLMLQTHLKSAWEKLYQRLSDILGQEFSEQLMHLINEANQKLAA